MVEVKENDEIRGYKRGGGEVYWAIQVEIRYASSWSQSSVAICPVRRQCPRFQATGYSRSRAVHDQGPRGYPVSEVEPMVRSETLLTTIVTLSLGRPHGSCKEARPEGLAGTKSPYTRVLNPTHAQETKTRERREEGGERKKRK